MERLLIVAVLTVIIHMINTLIYSVRLAGVRTGRLATALSLFQVIFLISSTANLIQAPLMSTIVEHAINTGQQLSTGADLLSSPYYREKLAELNLQIRFVILAGAVGTIFGGLLIPIFVNLFSNGIMLLEETGSVPRMITRILFSPRQVSRVVRKFRLPSVGKFRVVLRETMRIPKHFLFANVAITGIWTTGVLSALYAGALIPEFRSTATLTAGIINGVASTLAATVVDPTAAMITDQAMRGVRKDHDVKQMAVYLAMTRMLGTLLAQVIFVPAAYIVVFVVKLIV